MFEQIFIKFEGQRGCESMNHRFDFGGDLDSGFLRLKAIYCHVSYTMTIWELEIRI